MEVFVMLLALEREPRQKRRWGQIVARAWDDADYRQRLLAEPASVLNEEGIDVPPGVSVQVVEGSVPEVTEEQTCFWLPPQPDHEDLITDALSLPPDVYMGTVCHYTNLTVKTKPAIESRLVLPAQPPAADLVEDALSLPPDVYMGTVCHYTNLTVKTKPVIAS
jgi:hypothetical protein